MTTVRIARPEDPDGAALWDEARAAVERRTDADCCRGDLRLCRCEPAVREAEDEDDEWMAATGGEE